jgi:Zn-dependent peptidase ImmA (M78 family)
MVNINSLIEQRAEKLLIDSNSCSIPVQLTACAKYLGITVKNVELDADVSGFLLLKDDSTSHIGINKSDPANRRRFTLAHEIAHFVLHAKDSKLFVDKDEKVLYRDANSSTGELAKEKEANAFAAALLMPEKMLREEINNQKEEAKKKFITNLAKKFQVSEQAITIRLTNLGLIDYFAFAS